MFLFEAPISNTSMKTCIQGYLKEYILFFLKSMSTVELLTYMAPACLVLEELPDSFSRGCIFSQSRSFILSFIQILEILVSTCMPSY